MRRYRPLYWTLLLQSQRRVLKEMRYADCNGNQFYVLVCTTRTCTATAHAPLLLYIELFLGFFVFLFYVSTAVPLQCSRGSYRSLPAGEGVGREWTHFSGLNIQYLQWGFAPTLRTLLWQFSWADDTSKVPHRVPHGLIQKRVTNQSASRRYLTQ